MVEAFATYPTQRQLNLEREVVTWKSYKTPAMPRDSDEVKRMSYPNLLQSVYQELSKMLY